MPLCMHIWWFYMEIETAMAFFTVDTQVQRGALDENMK